MLFWLEKEGNLVSEEELVEDGINVHDLIMPQEYHDFWRDIDFKIPKGEISDLVLDRGDQFNGILSKYRRKRSDFPADFRIITLEEYGYYGYCKPYWENGLDNATTISRRHLRVGLVYRYEALRIRGGKKSIVFGARPIYLVVGEDAKKLNYEKINSS